MEENFFSDYYSLTNELVVRKILSDPIILNLFRTYGFIPIDEIIPIEIKDKFYYLANLLIENDTYIKDTSIEQLVEDEFLLEEIQTVFARTEIPTEIYKYIFYNYKYAAVKVFFQKNYNYFLPNFDFEEINSREKVRLFIKSFLREFDKFSDIINNLYEIENVALIDEQYLFYLAQLIGYTKEDEILSKNSSFRQFVKNIVDVYKIKGTNYAFELYLNFLGFTCTINEFWFDRRFYTATGYVNEWTKEKSKSKFGYYLTPIKPTESIPPDCNSTEVVNDDDITFIRNIYDFDRLALTTPVSELLGFTSGTYTGNTYTYFKTNYIACEVNKINDEGIIEAISQGELATLIEYTKIILPIFIIKDIYLNLVPFLDFFDFSPFQDEFGTIILSNPIMDSLGNLYDTADILNSAIPNDFHDFHFVSYRDPTLDDEILSTTIKIYSTIFDYYSGVEKYILTNSEPFASTIDNEFLIDGTSSYIREWKEDTTTFGDLYNVSVSKILFDGIDIKLTMS